MVSPGKKKIKQGEQKVLCLRGVQILKEIRNFKRVTLRKLKMGTHNEDVNVSLGMC